MKRVMLLSLLAMVLIGMTSTASMAAPLVIFQVNSVDTTADTLLNHAILAHGHLDASPVPLAAGLYEFEISVYAEAFGGEPLWTTTQPLAVQDGGILHANIYGIPGGVFFESDAIGNLHMVTRYLYLELPSLEKSIARVPIESNQNALSASRLYQFRLFAQWADHLPPGLPVEINEKINEFMKRKQDKEVINDLVEELVKQKVQMQQMQGIIDELKKKAGK